MRADTYTDEHAQMLYLKKIDVQSAFMTADNAAL